MKLSLVIDAYVHLQRSLGMQFISADKILRRFDRAIGKVDIEQVEPPAVITFLRGNGALSASWLLRYRVLGGLYRFAISRGFIGTSPLPVNVPKLPPQQTPYVYSIDELRRLIEATSTLHVSHSRQQASTYRTLLLLLYGTGLRIGEALGLCLSDIDLVERVITVRNTKFFKTRLVPIGPKLAGEIAAHIARRSNLSLPLGVNSTLFTTRSGRMLPYQHVITLFQRVRRTAGIECPAGEPRPPRLHDLRHTAAVHRVLAWYRTGRDVNLLLPQLATYLGHIDISSTQRYLQMTPELLGEAGRRFESYAQGSNGHA